MCRVFLFWMIYPRDPNIDYAVWAGFCDAMASWVMMGSVLTTGVIVGLYIWSARRKKIRTPQDLFAPYTPMYWLGLVLVPAVVVFIVYAIEYRSLFSGAAISYMAGAVPVGVETGILTFLLSYPLMWIPGITPAKYRYRPLWLFCRKKGARP